jgi:DnaJ-class molecular chaperone
VTRFYAIAIDQCRTCNSEGSLNHSKTVCPSCNGNGFLRREVPLQQAIAAVLKEPEKQ